MDRIFTAPVILALTVVAAIIGVFVYMKTATFTVDTTQKITNAASKTAEKVFNP